MSKAPDQLEIELQRSLLPKSKLALIERGDDNSTNYCCVFCHAKYTEKEKLEIHLCTHNKEYRFLCGICGTGLKRKEHLDRHMLEHEEKRPYVCPDCGKGFKRKEHLNIHSNIHTGEKSQSCTLCHKAFSRKDHLQKHLQTHTREMLERNIRTLREELGIKEEMDSDEDVKPIVIDGQVVGSDEEGYYSPHGLEEFMETEMIVPGVEDDVGGSEDEQSDVTSQDALMKPHACQVCHKRFKRKDHLKIHSWSHMKKEKICSECGKAFRLEIQLLSHMKEHLAGRGAGDSVAHLQALWGGHQQDSEMIATEVEPEEVADEHRVATSQEPPGNVDKPYQCPVCQKSYKRRDHLKIHAWTHLKKDKTCSECGKAFHLDSQLLSHMQEHSEGRGGAGGHVASAQALWGDDQQDEDSLLVPRSEEVYREKKWSPERPHECPVCLRRFKRKQHLKVHANIHRKQKAPIWCSLCNEGFHTNPEFENHRCLKASKANVNTDNVVSTGKKENEHPQNDDEESQVISSKLEHNIPVPQKVFVCKYCSKPFKRKDHFKIHLHIHTGIKSFFCTDCGRGFYRKDHLQKHMQVHIKHKHVFKPKREIPDLYPISLLSKNTNVHKNTPSAVASGRDIKPEITITAPTNTKLRVPLQIKVPYQMVMSMDNGEQRAVTVDPNTGTNFQQIMS